MSVNFLTQTILPYHGCRVVLSYSISSLAGFIIINRKLKEMYQTITLGGDAELELEDSLDPFAEGVSFSVRPPKKTWKKITNLSGGEKTLSSLSLVFALHHYKPTPFYVMDEIDAALDFKNVSIVGHYIKVTAGLFSTGVEFAYICLIWCSSIHFILSASDI